jgi:hypothetical protein
MGARARQELPAPLRLYARRWLMLAVFCVMSALYNLLVFAYVPVTTAVCQYYNGGTCTGDASEAVSIECVWPPHPRTAPPSARLALCPTPHHHHRYSILSAYPPRPSPSAYVSVCVCVRGAGP